MKTSAFLEHPLEQANFHVDTPEKGLDDAKIKKRMLGKRALVTRNTRDFLADAPVYDYGIIGLEAVAVDIAPTYAQSKTAQLISEAYSKFKLHSKRTGFVLMLKPDGNHVFRRLG